MREKAGLLDGSGGRLVVVGVGSPAQAADFARSHPMPFLLLADPLQKARAAYGVRQGDVAALMGPGTWLDYAKAIPAHGIAPAASGQEARQLPGAFVIGPTGRIRLAHYARSVIDWLPMARLVEALSAPDLGGAGRAPAPPR